MGSMSAHGVFTGLYREGCLVPFSVCCRGQRVLARLCGLHRRPRVREPGSTQARCLFSGVSWMRPPFGAGLFSSFVPYLFGLNGPHPAWAPEASFFALWTFVFHR